MTPATLPTLSHYRGDLWRDGVRDFGPVTFDGGTPPSPCGYVRMQFRNKETGALGYELTSVPAPGKGTIIIDNQETWILRIPEQRLPLDVGSWVYDIEIYQNADMATPPDTLWRGELNVIADSTHD